MACLATGGRLTKCSQTVYYFKKVIGYDQETPQSHTADQPMAPRGRVTEHLQ